MFPTERLGVAISRGLCLAYLVCSPHLLDARCKSIEERELVNALCRLPSMQSANLLNERESLWGQIWGHYVSPHLSIANFIVSWPTYAVADEHSTWTRSKLAEALRIEEG
jgi:hypothetical protein